MSSTSHPELIRSATAPSSTCLSLGGAASSASGRREMPPTRSQIEKTTDQTTAWAKSYRDRSDAYILETQYRNATSDLERMTLLDIYHAQGYITDRQKIWHKISMCDTSGEFSKSTCHQTRDKIPFVREAREKVYITEDEEARYLAYLHGTNPSGKPTDNKPSREDAMVHSEDV